MKCPKCGGEGKYFKKEKGNSCYVVSLSLCDECHGSGEIEVTNEEWLNTLPTEEKAKWIAKQKCDGCNDEPYDDKHGTCKYCMGKKTEQIRKWLKQPHTAK